MENQQDRLAQAPDNSPIALLLVDVINDLEFPGSEKLLQYALPMADALRAFKLRAKQAGIPAIYANDNFGRWRSDLSAVGAVSWLGGQLAWPALLRKLDRIDSSWRE